MALPNVHKRRRRQKSLLDKVRANNRRTTDDKSASRSKTLGEAVVNNLAIRPVKLASTIAHHAVTKDIPELAILSHAISSFMSDINHVFSQQQNSEKNRATEKTQEDIKKQSTRNVRVLETMNDSLKNINDSVIKQSSILDNSFGMLSTKLDGLDDIFAELRSLTSITAKVWDVNKRSLTNTRSANMTEVLKKKEARFAKTSQSGNKSFEDLEKEEKPIDQGKSKEDDKPNMLTAMTVGIGEMLGNMGTGLLKFVTGLIEGSGLAKLLSLTPVALLATIAASLGWREIQEMMKTDFSKIGSHISEAFSKDGLKGAIKAVMTDEQVKALAYALVKGWNDVFDPIIKAFYKILEWINPNLAKNVKKATNYAEDKIGQGTAWVAKKLTGDDVTGQENLDRINKFRKEHGLQTMSMEDMQSPLTTSNDPAIVSAKNTSRGIAERTQAQQAMQTQVAVAKDVAAMNSSTPNSSTSPMLMNNTNNVANNTSYNISNSGGDTRQQWKGLFQYDNTGF